MSKVNYINQLEERKKINLKQNIEFMDFYVKWIKTTPNKKWSRQQANFINSVLELKKEK